MKLLNIVFVLSLLLVLASCSTSKSVLSKDSSSVFAQGVASGDPTESAVVIWTRIDDSSQKSKKITWEMSSAPDMNNIIQSGEAKTDASVDNTVKVDVQNLQAGQNYYYRFKYKKSLSVVGKTKTLAKNPDKMSIGIVSCSNYEWGYFNAYESLANKDVDVILHLGDYIYEYAPGTYGDTTIGRKHIPAQELLNLADYRNRYKQYRTDPDLQRVHQMTPFVNIWDDHEISNDAYKEGAQNHQADEGDYQKRMNDAKKAYFEWMPTRLNGSEPLYRSYSSGQLADIIMLDERLEGRTKPIKSKGEATLNHTMLGEKQLNWFKNQLSDSDAIWKIIGNQVIFSPLDVSRVYETPVNFDAWDGYERERNSIASHLKDEEISNVVFVTGDTHTSWAFEVPVSTREYRVNQKSYAIEIGTPSISSANWNEGRATEETIFAEKMVLAANQHLKYINGRDHGYVILHLMKDKAVAEWYHVSTLRERKYTEKLAKRIEFSADGASKFN